MEDNLHNELEQLSPLLLEIRKKPEGFQVPEDYFAKLQSSVLTQVKDEKTLVLNQNIAQQKATDKPSLWTLLIEQIEWLIRPKYAIAFASVVVMIMAGWFLLKPEANSNCNTLACVSDDEIHQYLEENIDEVETEQLWKSIENEESFDETATIKEEKVPTNTPNQAPLKLQEANDKELDEMIDEMIQNGELDDEDLEEIL